MGSAQEMDPDRKCQAWVNAPPVSHQCIKRFEQHSEHFLKQMYYDNSYIWVTSRLPVASKGGRFLCSFWLFCFLAMFTLCPCLKLGHLFSSPNFVKTVIDKGITFINTFRRLLIDTRKAILHFHGRSNSNDIKATFNI